MVNLTPEQFVIFAGESIPLTLTVEKDGNGNDMESLADYSVIIESREVTRCNPGERSPPPEVDKSSELSGDDGITISGRTASWVWTAAETAEFPKALVFYVKLVNTDGLASVVAYGHVNTRRP